MSPDPVDTHDRIASRSPMIEGRRSQGRGSPRRKYRRLLGSRAHTPSLSHKTGPLHRRSRGCRWQHTLRYPHAVAKRTVPTTAVASGLRVLWHWSGAVLRENRKRQKGDQADHAEDGKAVATVQGYRTRPGDNTAHPSSAAVSGRSGMASTSNEARQACAMSRSGASAPGTVAQPASMSAFRRW